MTTNFKWKKPNWYPSAYVKASKEGWVYIKNHNEVLEAISDLKQKLIDYNTANGLPTDSDTVADNSQNTGSNSGSTNTGSNTGSNTNTGGTGSNTGSNSGSTGTNTGSNSSNTGGTTNTGANGNSSTKTNPNYVGSVKGSIQFTLKDGTTSTITPSQINVGAVSFAQNGNLNVTRGSSTPISDISYTPNTLTNAEVQYLTSLATYSVDAPTVLTLNSDNALTAKKKGNSNVVVTISDYQLSTSYPITVTTKDTLNVTVQSAQYATNEQAKVVVTTTDANMTYTISGIDSSLITSSSYYDSGSNSTSISIKPNVQENINQDYTITVTCNDGTNSGSDSYVLKAYVDTRGENTVDNKSVIKGHVDTFKDINDSAVTAYQSGNYTIFVNGTSVGSVTDLKNFTGTSDISFYVYSGHECYFTNNTDQYQVIDIVASTTQNLQLDSSWNSSYTALPNVTYDGDKTTTIYLAPKRQDYLNSKGYATAKSNRPQSSYSQVLNLDESTTLKTPIRATLIVNGQYAFVDENFTGDYANLLTKAKAFVKVQDSSGTIALYNTYDQNADFLLIRSDKVNPFANSNLDFTYYDATYNIGAMFFPAKPNTQ